MNNKTGILNHKELDKIVFALSVFVCVFWITAQQFNVYHFAVVGAIYELLSVPILLLFIVLQTVSIIFLVKQKFSFKSLYLYSFLLLFWTFLYLNKYMFQ